MLEAKIKHLEMIQNVIDRMAGNLFFLKGWSITLIAALFALAAKDTEAKYILIAYIPVFVFWLLDGYFLSQERLYRSLYNDVRKLEEKDVDFSMDTSKYLKKNANTWIAAIFAPTLLAFYGPLVAVMLVVMLLVKQN